MNRVDSDKWLEQIGQDGQRCTRAQKISNFATLSEKASPMNLEKEAGKDMMSGGRRSVRTLPFSREVFHNVTQKFLVHGSIARCISRSDIPVFSSTQVEMGGPDGPKYSTYGVFQVALGFHNSIADSHQVYNCRTTHAWETDLALTATYFPHCGLTYAILFGCPVAIEEDIIKRLCSASSEATHPLVMPGIFAELERNRHVHVVEKTISHLETQILELEFQQADMDGPPDRDAENRNYQKREAWLDTAYLRNGLINWKTQLGKMAEHMDELQGNVFKDLGHSDTKRHEFNSHMRRTGGKIKARILELSEEYDEKIRDCTMRVDGMAMATQWVGRPGKDSLRPDNSDRTADTR